jgi:uridine phosphorylase
MSQHQGPELERGFSHSGNPGIPCAESVILLPFGRRSYLPAVVAALDGEAVPLDETTDREVYTLHGAPVPLTLVYSGMGGPAAANALEMAAANGARRVITFGACGGLGPALAAGDLVVATGAVRGEGTSAWYAPAEYPAVFDPELVVRLLEAARGTDLPVHRGVVFTTDASYRQGPELYATYADLAVAIECECATVAVVAARLGLAAAALLFCSDNVAAPRTEDRTYRGLAAPRVRRGFSAGLGAVVQALTSVAAAGSD